MIGPLAGDGGKLEREPKPKSEAVGDRGRGEAGGLGNKDRPPKLIVLSAKAERPEALVSMDWCG